MQFFLDLSCWFALGRYDLETGGTVRDVGIAVRERHADGMAGGIHTAHDPGTFRNVDVDHLEASGIVRHVGMVERNGHTSSLV